MTGGLVIHDHTPAQDSSCVTGLAGRPNLVKFCFFVDQSAVQSAVQCNTDTGDAQPSCEECVTLLCIACGVLYHAGRVRFSTPLRAAPLVCRMSLYGVSVC